MNKYKIKQRQAVVNSNGSVLPVKLLLAAKENRDIQVRH